MSGSSKRFSEMIILFTKVIQADTRNVELKKILNIILQKYRDEKTRIPAQFRISF